MLMLHNQESGFEFLSTNIRANKALVNTAVGASCMPKILSWGTPEMDSFATQLKAAVASSPTEGRSGCLIVGSDLTYQPNVFQKLAETLRALVSVLQGTESHILIAHDDASHPGCPYHRATFFGSDGKADKTSKARSRHAKAVALSGLQAAGKCDVDPTASDENKPSLKGGILQSMGFHVESVDQDAIPIPKDWQVDTVHIFSLQLKPLASPGNTTGV
eukprot:SAG31_NODE_10268_length_1162_cov_2.295390_1_plen_218_part_00